MGIFYFPELSQKILDLAYKVHTELGPGLLESTYESCLEYEMVQSGLHVERQKRLPLQYGSLLIEDAYRIDLFVENKIIIEIKSVDRLVDLHFRQILTYLKLAQVKVGYLINFNVDYLKNGISRKVL